MKQSTFTLRHLAALFFLALLQLSTLKTNAQCMQYPVSLQERVDSSTMIVVGKLKEKFCSWDAPHRNIYTVNIIEITAFLKGQSNIQYIAVINDGGIVGMQAQITIPTLKLYDYNEYALFLRPQSLQMADLTYLSRFPGIQLMEAYAGPQGAITKQFDKYRDLLSEPVQSEASLFSRIKTYTGLDASDQQGALFAPRFPSISLNSGRATDALSSFSPSSTPSGTIVTSDFLTITGSGFGASAGSVYYANGDDGGITQITNNISSDIVSWADGSINVKVPSEAGTGTIKVNSLSSASNLTVPYSHICIEDAFSGWSVDTRQRYYHRNMNSNGGYTFEFNNSFLDSTLAVASFKTALNTWRCNIGINFTFSNTGTSSTYANDNQSVVMYDAGLSAGTLARATTRLTGGSVGGCTQANTVWCTDEIDVQYDPTPGSSKSWYYGTALSSGSFANQYDFVSVSTHELGHACGLGHRIAFGEVMHYSVSTNVANRTPSANEITGGTARVTYSTATTCLNPSSCGSGPMVAVASTSCDVTLPEINIQGNSTTIADGDASPTSGDNTDFGNQLVCSGSVSKTFTIQNTSTLNALSLSGSPIVVVGGTNSGDFTVTQPSSSSVAANGSINFSVSFNPSATGTRSATLSIANNDQDEGTYNFSIQGTGIEPEINVQGNGNTISDGDATPVTTDYTDFGNTTVCGNNTFTRIFTIQNTGTTTLNISGYNISGTNAADFSITSNPSSTVAASGSSNIEVTFNPSATGVRSATLNITSDDCNEATYNFSIQGTGVEPEINVQGNSTTIADGDATPTSTDHTDFGNVVVCGATTFVRTFTIQNTGTSSLTVSTPTFSGTNASDFTVTANPSSPVSSAGSTTFQVTFNPSGTGTRSATVTISNSDCDEATYDFAIQGTGVEPEIDVQSNSTSIADGDVSPSATDNTDFGNQVVCSGSVVKTFTILNSGTSSLAVSTPTFSGTNAADFSISAAPSGTVTAAGSTTFQVSFNPSGTGTRSAILSISNSDCDEGTYDFAIQGNGVEPEINVQSNSTTIADGDVTPTTTDNTDFGNQLVCSGSVVKTFTIQNTGTSSLSVTGVTVSGTNAADFTVSASPSSSIVASGTTTFDITFNPSATGSRTATITIANGDCDEATYDFSIQGTGIEPEINVQGNSTTITDGDVTPNTTDGSDFGSQSVCSGSVVKTFTIQNTGTASLTVTGVSITGTNAADFSVTTPPSGTVTAAGNTTFQVTFNPSATGTRTATVTIANSDCDETSYDFAIQGTGGDPEINLQGNSNSIADGDVTPTTTDHTDFGNVNVCGTQTFTRTYTIQNTGTATLNITGVTITGTNSADFSVTTSPGSSIAAAGSTTFVVTFNPSALGSRTATVNVASDDCDEATYDFAIQGTGVDPEADIQGNSISIADDDATPSTTDNTDFGNQSSCSGTISKTFTILNTGTATLFLDGANISGTNAADFTITVPPSSSINAASSSTFTVVFNPSAVGLRSAAVNVLTGDCDEGTYTFAIQGTGTDPEINVQGNSTSIADGDVTPSSSDFTDFGNQVVCSGTFSRTFTIQNTGSSSLNVTGVTFSGTNAADFSVTSSPSSTVAGSSSTTFVVAFNPSALGTRTATLTIANDDCDEGTYDFAIQGTGVDPEINVQGNSQTIPDGSSEASSSNNTDFGSQSACSGTVTRTFTIQNTGTSTLNISGITFTGTAASDFTVTVSPASTVAASGSTTFTVTFNPSAVGPRSATLNIASDDCDEATYNFAIQGIGTDQDINLQGNGTSIVDGDITPSSTDHTDFGNQVVCSGTFARTFTIQNLGSATLSVTGVTITGTNAADFTVTSTPASTVAVSGQTSFVVTFNPSALGSRTATVNVASDDCDEGTYDFAIQGTGVDPEINVQGNSITIVDGDVTPQTADLTDFGNASTCSGTVVHTFTIQNTGTSDLHVSQVTISGTNSADFELTNEPGNTIQSGGSSDFEITFNPSFVGLHTATVTVLSDDCDEATYDYAIQGTGTDPEINVQGNSVSITDGDITPSSNDFTDFGSQVVCTGAFTRTFTIQNTGTSALSVSSVTIAGTNAGDFSVSSPPAASVAGSSSTTFVISFNPSALGARTANISIASDDCDEGTYDFAIQGTGIETEINLQGNGLSITDGDATPSSNDFTDFGSQSACTGTVSKTFTIQNTGTAILNIGSVTITGANASDFTVTSSPASTVATSGSTNFTVTFNPSATGLRSATVNIASDDCDEATYDFAIQGTGTDQDINVQGNSLSIIDGDVTPSNSDFTDFGTSTVCVGSITQTFTIQNVGTATLSVTGVSISGTNAADFTVGTSPASTVAASGSTNFTITFNASALGTRNATVTIANDDCDEGTYDFAIQGTGVDPEINLQGNSVSIADGDVSPSTSDHTDFGSQSVCSGTIVRTFTIQNTGTSTLNISGSTITGTNAADFSITSAPASTVATASSTTIQVTFNPSAIGTRSATLTINSDDCNEASYDFAIQGTGTDAEINVQGNGLDIQDGGESTSTDDGTDFGAQLICTGSISHTFTIQSTGNTPLTINSVTISGPNAADFTVTTPPGSPVASGSSTTFTITFNPSGSDGRYAWVSISNDDCNENPYEFPIEGAGVFDETGPNAVCKNITIQLDATGNASITGTQIDNGSTDNCGVENVTVFPNSFTCANIGANTVTLTVTDEAGNSGTCSATVTVVDNTAPVANCQNITTQLDGTGNVTITGAQLNNLSTDACGINAFTASPSAFTCANVGANTVVLTVTDANGNSSTCSSTVTIQDLTSPTVNGTSVTVQLDGNGNASVTGSQFSSGVSDACGILSISAQPNTFTCAELGSNTVALGVTDVNGNFSSGTATVIVEDHVAPVLSLQSNLAVCATGPSGAIVNYSAATFTDNCSGGSITQTLGLASGSTFPVGVTTNSFRATDAQGNSANASFTVTVYPAPVADFIASNTCTNLPVTFADNSSISSGSITQYSWNFGDGGSATTQNTSHTYLNATTYSVSFTATSSLNCSTTIGRNITTYRVPSAISSSTPASCHGGSDGTGTVTVSEGFQGMNYSWSPYGGTGASASGLTAQTYSVLLTETDHLCTATVGVTVTEPTAITATISSQTNIICGASNGSATVDASGGTGDFTYAWSPNGGNAATANNLSAQAYTVLVTDENLCTASANVTITETSSVNLSIAQLHSISCYGANDGSATIGVSGGTGNYSYAWSPSGGTGASASGLSPQLYTVLVTDLNTSCSASINVSITQPNQLSVFITEHNNVTCHGANNGYAAAFATGGSEGYTYQWSPTGGTSPGASGLTAQTYTVLVHDGNQCTASATVTITEPAAISVSLVSKTDISCKGLTDGAITISASGGAGSLDYSWSPTGGNAAAATSLPAATYTVLVTDDNQCTADLDVTIIEPTELGAAINSVTPVSCHGANNGMATVTGIGGTSPYTYAWSPVGGNAATATGLSPQVYTVSVTDNHQCSTTINVTVTEPTAVTATIIAQADASCNNGSNGSATAAGNGGTGGYTYSWSPIGGNNATATNLPAGVYTATVRDVNQCPATVNVTVTEPSALTITPVSQTQVTCHGGNDATASVTAAGGTPPLAYAWTFNGGNGNVADSLAAGTYQITVTDLHHCSATTSITITEPEVLVATISTQTNVSCYGGSDGSATVTTTGGTGPVTFLWLPGNSITATINNLSPQLYDAIATDANGCTASVAATINQPNQLTGTASQSICNGNTFNFNGTLLTGTGVYVDTFTAVSGCDSIVTLNLNVTPAFTASFSASICSGQAYTFGGNSYTITGNYNDTLTASSGCDSIITLHLSVGNMVTAVANAHICGGESYNFGGSALTSPGIYRDTTSTSGGCDSVTTLTLTVTDIDTSATVNGATCLANQLGATYQWINCANGQPVAGAVNRGFTASQNGDYRCVISYGNCTDSTGCLTVTGIVGIVSPVEYSFSLYPNPNSGAFVLQHNYAGPLQVQIVNAIGQRIREFTLTKQVSSVDISEFAAGVYELMVKDEMQLLRVIKVVKQ